MKTIVVLALLAISTSLMAAQDKCYESAKRAAFYFVRDSYDVSSMTDFEKTFGDENVEVSVRKNYQKEYWSFASASSIINVEMDAIGSRCYLKNIDLSQNDQD